MILEIFMKAFQVMLHPFRTLQKEEDLTYHHLTLYAAVLGLLPAVAQLLSRVLPQTVEGSSEVVRPSFSFDAILCSLGYWVMVIVSVWVMAYLLRTLSLYLARRKHLGQSLRVMAYAMTPVFFSYILAFSTMLSNLLLAYGIFILLLGIRSLEPHKKYGIFLYLWGIIVYVLVQLITVYLISKC